MSLLMEALKKAEEAKRRASDSETHAPSPALAEPAFPMSAEEAATGSARNSPLPNLALNSEVIDMDLALESEPAPARQPTPPPADHNASARADVRNLFAAKQPTQSRNALWLFVGLGFFAAIGVGAYFWWQLQGIPSGNLLHSAPPMQPARPATTSEKAPDSIPSTTTRPAAAPAPSVATVPEKATPTISGPVSAKPLPTPSPSVAKVQKPSSASAASIPPRATSDSPVRLSKSQPTINPVLERAYDNLQAGRQGDAQHDYEQVLRSDAKNTDALLGLATIAAQQGQSERAHAYYSLALESNPTDPTAKAGVISTRGQDDADVSESRLKSALSSQTDSPPLLFALGNLYARQGRWSEAQQVYFRAYTTDPDNPDFIFNVAVSLDHLRQTKLAAQYYQMALTAGETKTASFDRNQARNRILELQP